MNLNKSQEYFDPEALGTTKCHIIGCGAIGSTVTELLARLGVSNIVLWDDDIVEPHNLTNQLFFDFQKGRHKVSAVSEIALMINPEIETTTKMEKYIAQNLSGYVFLCVDDIETRKAIAETNKNNPNIKAMFDFRMRLVDAQHYATPWDDQKERGIFLDSMDFSHDEAVSETPLSACGIALSVAPTVRTICSAGVANFMNFVRTGKLQRLILIDAFDFTVDAFPVK